jgi:hypothetical protein
VDALEAEVLRPANELRAFADYDPTAPGQRVAGVRRLRSDR